MKKIHLKKEREFFRKVVNKISLSKILLFFILPIITTITILLPANIQESLRFNLENPRIWQFLTSAYVHTNLNHFLGNLLLYIIISLIIIYIAAKTQSLEKVNKWLLFILISLPIADNVLIKYFLISTFTGYTSLCGASGIVSALLGFLPLMWIISLKEKLKHSYYLMSFFIIYIGIFVVMRYTNKIILKLIIFLTLIIFGLCLRTDFKKLGKATLGYGKDGKVLSDVIISCFSLLIFLLMPYATFPAVLQSGGTITNIFAHYLGMVYGLIVSFIYFRKEISEK